MNEATGERGLPPLFDFKAVAGALWRGRLIIAGTTAALIGCAVLYVVTTPPVYTATASILVDPRDSRATNYDSVLPGIGADSAAIASQVSVIDSRDLLGKVYDEEHIAGDPEFAGHPGLLSRLIGLLKPPRPASSDAIYKRFQDSVSVEREGLTYVIDVSFRSRDPEKAARVANAIVAEYKAMLAGEAEAANRQVTSLLKERIGSLQDAVTEAARTAEDYKFKHNIYDAQSGGTLQSQIDRLTAQLGTAQDDADRAENRYQQALKAGDSPEGLNTLSQILTSKTTEQLRDEYNQRAAALANAETIYGSHHPTIIRLRAELAKVKGLIAAEAERIRQQLKAARDLAEDNVQKLQAKLTALRQKSNESSLAQVELRQLQSKADAARAVLDDFVNRSQQTAQMQGIQLSQVRVISSALPPVQPSWPKPKLLLPVAAVLGLFAGCALALILASEAAPAVAAGTAPMPARREDDADEDDRRPMVPAELGRYVLPAGDGGTPWSGIKAVRHGLYAAESARLSLGILKLLTQAIQGTERHARPFVLVVSSLTEGMERRLAAALIGIGLQEVNETVLVVDVSRAGDRASPSYRAAVERAPLRLSVDPASGLPTTTVGADRLRASGPTAIALEAAELIGETRDAFDFLIIAARPMDEDDCGAALAESADL
ncbi:MAG: GumC family protein, partial [Pararhizobium sp.]